MNPKISIIVPVYKVEKYIHKCIDSILNQTFKDFELILVNDGSPDKCGEICNEYANKDDRIIVIHKENSGLSSARNEGLNIARGKYIGFVDSDDYIESDMYDVLYNICEINRCDIASCSSIIYFPDKTIINGGHGLIIHDKSQAMKTMLEGKLYDEVVWVKLFKRSVIGEIRFPVGRIYEDTSFTYRVIDRANKVATIGIPKYNYIKHDNSIMSNAIKNIKIDAVVAYEEMYKFIEEKYPELCDLVALKLANSSMVIMNLIIKSDNFKKYKYYYYRTAKVLNKKFYKIIKLKEYPKNVKILLVANKINPILYKNIIKAIYGESMKRLFLKIYYYLLALKDKCIIFYNTFIITKMKQPIVMDTQQTLDKIINDKCSISRFGDGEFSLLYGESLKFQPANIEISDKLKQILKSNENNHIVCIPDIFGEIEWATNRAKNYWRKYLKLNRRKIYKVIDKEKSYYNSLVTKFYIDLKDKSKIENKVEKMKSIWNEREVVIVEGEKSRLGIGNDLFNSAKSIGRIICPSINAYSKYNEIFKEVIKMNKSKLILIALGPTATVLSYELSKIGYQAIDIGHIDIEYEWFISGVHKKCPVKNKYIGEINGGDIVEGISDKEYFKEIIKIIV